MNNNKLDINFWWYCIKTYDIFKMSDLGKTKQYMFIGYHNKIIYAYPIVTYNNISSNTTNAINYDYSNNILAINEIMFKRNFIKIEDNCQYISSYKLMDHIDSLIMHKDFDDIRNNIIWAYIFTVHDTYNLNYNKEKTKTKENTDEFLNIKKEFQEFANSIDYNNKILTICKLTNLVNAIKVYAEKYNLTIEDLNIFANSAKNDIKNNY